VPRRIALLALAAPRRVIAVALLVFLGTVAFGLPVAKDLSAGGFYDPASESAQANRLLEQKFGESEQQLLIVVTAPGGPNSAPARAVGTDIVEHLERSRFVFHVSSPWTSTAQTAGRLVSKDGRSGLIVANLRGGDNNAPKHAGSLSGELVRDRDGVTVRAGGLAMAYAQVNNQIEHDLVTMESIAIPLSFLAMVWVFGGLLAAALPIAVGLVAIVGCMAILRLLTFTTEVSVYALNLATALGLALAIDYTLLIVSRYRDELAGGSLPDRALIRTMQTAGRTVLYSATTVALSMAVMVLFPMFFLRSFAYAGVATVAFAAIAAVVVTPAAIVWLGPRLDGMDMRRLIRGMLRRREPARKPVQQLFWYRSTRLVMRHAVPVGLAVTALVTLAGFPFLGVKWGFPDDRVLPRSASAHQVGDQLRNDFADDFATTVQVVIPDARGLDAGDLERYAAELSRVPEVAAVSAPTATFVGGTAAGPPAAPTGIADGSAFLTVTSTSPPFSRASDRQLDRLHAVDGPRGRAVALTGLGPTNRDGVDAITARLPLVLGLIAVITAVLLFLVTGSVVLPVKTLVLNVLSLSATFGALVWIFQDGHLGGLGITTTGRLVANMPVLLFCIAFGLSMDYEIFLVARIREYWLASRKTAADNDESIALGVAYTGRVITAAALVMAMAFAALSASQVSFMRMFGVGLTLAVLADATLVRMILVPAVMHVLGRVNWWAPKPLAWLHGRIGIDESGGAAERPGGRHARRSAPARWRPAGSPDVAARLPRDDESPQATEGNMGHTTHLQP